MRVTRTRILLLTLILLLAFLLACGDPPTPEPTPCDQLKGMDRFTPDVIERCGCPDENKVPVWMEIPECPAT